MTEGERVTQRKSTRPIEGFVSNGLFCPYYSSVDVTKTRQVPIEIEVNRLQRSLDDTAIREECNQRQYQRAETCKHIVKPQVPQRCSANPHCTQCRNQDHWPCSQPCPQRNVRCDQSGTDPHEDHANCHYAVSRFKMFRICHVMLLLGQNAWDQAA